MDRKDRENSDDIYENHAISGQSRQGITDRNAMRIQSSSQLTGTANECEYKNIEKETNWRIQKRGRRTPDDIYENDVIRGISGEEITDRIQSSECTGSNSGKLRSFRSATACLMLLCFLLLTAVIVLSVCIYTNNINYTEKRCQLLTNITNLTQDRDKLLANTTDLTEKSNQLIQNNTNLLIETAQLKWKKENLLNQLKKIQTADGWTYFQSSFYYKSNITKKLNESRSDCIARGADLIIINNREEQDFLKRMSGVAAVWIGLNDRVTEGIWRWVDGSTLNTSLSFWAPESKEPNGGTSENCVASADKVTEMPFLSGWVDVPCDRTFQWICEMNISQLI